MMDTNVSLEESWFHLADDRKIVSCPEVPQLWNERVRSQIQLRDGMLGNETKLVHGVYGGVDLKPAEKSTAPATFEISIIWEAPAPPTAKPRRQRQQLARQDGSGAAPSRRNANYFGYDYSTVGPPERGSYVELQIPERRSQEELELEKLQRTERDLRGVDLNLDSFDLSVVRRVPLESPEETWCDDCQCLDDGVLIGNAFWSDLDVKGQAFQEDDRELLRQIFQPRLSDRRLEGDRFVPPDVTSTNMDKLRSLLKNEEWIRLQRKTHFFSKKFSTENPGSFFPLRGRRLSKSQTAMPRAFKRSWCHDQNSWQKPVSWSML
jgi:hypothetical protein